VCTGIAIATVTLGASNSKYPYYRYPWVLKGDYYTYYRYIDHVMHTHWQLYYIKPCLEDNSHCLCI